MIRQRGLLSGHILYAVLALGAVTLASGGWAWVQGKRLESCQAEFAAFQAQVKALGEKAEREAKETEARNLKAKETADAEAKRLTADNAALARKLRDARSRSRFVPPASPVAASPGRACFDRAELERTLQRLDDGISSIVAEGDAGRVGLDTAREWASSLKSR